MPYPPKCTRPPTGWRCSRGYGHDGPCAATPERSPSWAQLTPLASDSPICDRKSVTADDAVPQRIEVGAGHGDVVLVNGLVVWPPRSTTNQVDTSKLEARVAELEKHLAARKTRERRQRNARTKELAP